MPRAKEYRLNPKQHIKEAAEYRAKHPEKYRKDAMARARRNRDLLVLLKSQPCTDCGVEYPHYVMEFDHVGDNKQNNVSRMTSMATGKMLLEVAKCDTVCANCHKIRTWRRNQEDWKGDR